MATIAQAKEAVARNKARLMAVPSIFSVATSVIDGEPVILVFLSRKPSPGDWLPTYLDGVRVVARITGEIQAL